ncbi:hypothetical protein [Frigoriflavimonas asaccharolytica]|uniref:Uncharacterized protein n=1 Tax=Frigoriflavimonas asaccharolytica TaxID=2735899 RepID=A0A8J8K770_9FLAO|nr:hypothetical protein [Frigoriflavimonas asaccharolytica]NRS91201.1 hypothetical protein [Frigoriflavimonas asaccharolytica]
MKNFDLEQIKNRKHQEMPEAFYKKMQENVLNNTINTTKIVELKPKAKLNWIYAAAASLAIIFGGTYFFQENNLDHKTVEPAEQMISKIEIPESSAAEDSIFNTASVETIQPEQIIEEAVLEKEKNIVLNDAAKSSIAKTETKKQVKIIKPQDQIDFLLENFTPEDMAILAKNSDQDVYLDLY